MRFGLLWAVACGHPATTKPTLDNHGPGLDVAGAYWCAIEDSGFTYDRFPCVIRRHGSKLELAKLAGSQRFEGEIEPAASGFSFRGRFYCPFGDCTQALHGAFIDQGGGVWRGTFSDAKFVVKLTRAADRAFGGGSYGGDGYGGDRYGVSPLSNRRR